MKHVGRNGRLLLGVMLLAFAAIGGLPTYSHGQSARVEPKADQLLKKMGTYLSGLEQFGVETENTIEAVLRSGEKIQFDNPAEGWIKRPNKLRANRKGDIVNQEFYYGGKTLTLYQKDRNCYATVEAPPTIDEAIDFAREFLDVYAPRG
jgi:hypothetical protein